MRHIDNIGLILSTQFVNKMEKEAGPLTSQITKYVSNRDIATVVVLSILILHYNMYYFAL